MYDNTRGLTAEQVEIRDCLLTDGQFLDGIERQEALDQLPQSLAKRIARILDRRQSVGE